MKKIILSLVVMSWAYLAHGQTLTLKDQLTSEPIEMATLMSHSPKTFVVTNAKGQADISLFKGSEKIEIRMLGYRTEIKSYQELEKMNFELSLLASATQFDEIVVSATRWGQTSRTVPSRISIITAKDVALQNPQTVADLLGASGEVFIQKSQQGGGSPMIRGFATNRLLYTIDGIRMNSAIFRAGNLQNVISLDAFAIESTEVFFGAGSVIYGSDAIGGVMSFQALTPQFSATEQTLVTGKAISRYSSANNELTNHFDINVGGKKWSSVTSFTYSKFGDLRMGKNGGKDEYLKRFYVQRIDNTDRMVENPDPLVQNPSGYSQINLMQKIRFSPHRDWDLQYGFHYSETSDYARYDRLIEKTGALPTSAVWNYGAQIWSMNNLNITHKASNRLYDHLTIRLAHQYFEESRIDRRFNNNRLRTNLEKVQAYSVNFDFEKRFGKHQLYYGVEYVLNDVGSFGSAVDISNNNPIAVADRYPTSKWNSYAGYLSYQLTVNQQLLLQAGMRYNAFDIQADFTRQLKFFPFDFTQTSLQNSALTGNIGLVFTPSDTWKISATASTGFRAPNVDDMGKIFDFATGEVVVPNTNLQAEYAYNTELSISKRLGEYVRLDVTGFYTYLDKAMVRRPFKVNGQDSIQYNGRKSKVYAIQNAAFGTVYGFNAGIEVKLPSGFGFSSRYNYQLGKEEMDNGQTSRSRHAAPAFGVSRLFYQKEKVSLQLYATYSAEVSYEHLNPEEQGKPVIYAKDENGKPYSPSWYTLNFKGMYQFHPNLSLSAGVENITDQRYRPYSSGLVAAGRNFVLALRANF